MKRIISDVAVDVYVWLHVDVVVYFGFHVDVDVAVEVDSASEFDTDTKVDLVDNVDDVDNVVWLCGDVVIDNNNETSGPRVELYLGVVSKTGEVGDALFGTFVVICKNVLSVSG